MDNFSSRLKLNKGKLEVLYKSIYGSSYGYKKKYNSFLSMLETNFIDRSRDLRILDNRDKDWFMKRDIVGMMLYVDLFSKDFKTLTSKIPYLKELGITYVHLMPLLKSREGENDGGYAIEDYLDVDPKLGTKEEFLNVIESFRNADIDICIDYVINHTADTHKWARKALLGKKEYQQLYEMYDDRKIPDEYEKTVPEVLPDKCPGNFTFKPEIKKWVFTSFSEFQWDLNFKNPTVFEYMVDTLLKLANMGINIIRLDAIPFMWKEVGTQCRNLPEVHTLIKMIHLAKEIVCPGVVLLGEAIVEAEEIFKYFGTEEEQECGLLYNANMMVNIWNAIATRDVRLLNIDNSRFKEPATGSWMNYVRCHDDIGWGFNEQAIQSFGMDPYLHKQYLINFFAGKHPGSFAKGEIYQFNPKNNDARTNGTCASLCGLEKAIDEMDLFGIEESVRRVILVHALIFSHRGIPLIYSGDELAFLNDQSYKENLDKKDEGRWVHRPQFDWKLAEGRSDTLTPQGRVFSTLKDLIQIRNEYDAFDGNVDVEVIHTNQSVYTFKRKNTEEVVFMFNFSENQQYVNPVDLQLAHNNDLKDIITNRKISIQETIQLHPYEFLWLVRDKEIS